MEWDNLFDFFRVRPGGAIIDCSIEYHEGCTDCRDGGTRRCVILDILSRDGKELHQRDPLRSQAEHAFRHIIPFIICDCRLRRQLGILKKAEGNGTNGKPYE